MRRIGRTCAMARLLVLALACAYASVVTCGEGDPQDRFVSSLIHHLNSNPERSYLYEEGILVSARRKSDNAYEVEANVKARDPRDRQRYKLLRCHGELLEAGDQLELAENSAGCLEDAPVVTESAATDLGDTQVILEEVTTGEGSGETQSAEELQVQSTEELQSPAAEADGGAVRLDHEVLPSNQATSGEQFVAVRREHTGPCVGCASLVSLAAPGVAELAQLAVRHISRHEPAATHRLARVLTVERQVQVVNGVRYILTLDVEYDTCSSDRSEGCLQTKTCRVSVLEKPWLKLPDGSKFRAVVSNNCTSEYLFGDNGEVLPTIAESSSEKDNEIDVNFNPDEHDDQGKNQRNSPTPDYDAIANSGSADDILKVVNKDLQATMPNYEKELTAEEIKNLEEQIIPYSDRPVATESTTQQKIQQEKQVETYDSYVEPIVVEKSIAGKASTLPKQTSLSIDKQKALDGIMDYFNFNGQENLEHSDTQYRMRRSIDKADEPFVQKLANLLVSTLNSFDSHEHNRNLLEVLSADEEIKDGKLTFYIRAKVAFPNHDNNKDDHSTVKVCNGMFDASNPDAPRLLKSFCNRFRESRMLGERKPLDLDSPEILHLVEQALNKIQTESSYDSKVKVLNILSADKQVVSGTLIRISLELGFTDCPKSSSSDIAKCNIQPERGSTICKIHSLKQMWLNSNKITFTCIDAPVQKLIQPQPFGGNIEVNVSDPKIVKLAEEALQHFEDTSKSSNRLKILKIHSATQQVVEGTLTNIIYDVVFTKCTKDDAERYLESCDLLENSPTQICQAEIWNRPWIKNGKHIDINCEIEGNISQRIMRLEKSRIGGPMQQNPDDFKDLTLLSLKKLEQLSDSQYQQKIVKIQSVTTQVVSGISTKIHFYVGYTKCSRNDLTIDINDCELLENQPLRNCYSDIWDRPWLKDGKHIDVHCNNDSTKLNEGDSIRKTKRDIVTGAPVQGDVKDPENIRLAEESLQQLEKLNDSQYKQKLLKITSVTTQLVAGTLTVIDFQVAYSKCLRSEVESSAANCELLEDKPIRNCHSSIWNRPWLKDGKQITVTCDDLIKRTKRDTCGLPGGVCSVDETDPEYLKLAQDSLLQLEQLSDSQYKQKIMKITHVTSQVVAGTLTNLHFQVAYTNCLRSNHQINIESECELLKDKPIRNCHSSIWNRPWLKDGKQITVTCDDLIKRTKRDTCGLPGGVCSVDETDPEYLKLAQDSLLQLEQLSDSQYKQKIMKITHVTSQVVAGTLTNLHFQVAYTNCLRSNHQINIESECELLKDKPIRNCHSSIWNRPWLKDGKQITVTCDDLIKLTKRDTCGLPGGVCSVDETDPEYLKLAQDSLLQLEQLSDSQYKQKIMKITHVTSQVVAGTLTNLHFQVAYTNCLRSNHQINIESECELLKDKPIRNCHSSIWNRPWLKDGKQITVTCDDLIKRTKRDTCGLPGGVCSVDETDPEYLKLAQDSLLQLEQLSDSQYKQKIMKITHVTSQVVAGTLTNLHFQVAYTNCLRSNHQINIESECELLKDKPIRNCHSEIWDRPWLKNGKQINVTCNDDSTKLNEGDSIRKTKRDIVTGGPVQGDVKDPENIRLAEESLQQLEKLNDSQYKQKLLKITSVTTQLVAGTLTVIDFQVAYSKCLRSEVESSAANCELLEDKPIRNCHSSIWNRPWLKDGKQITVTCDDLIKRTKRDTCGLPGGVCSVDETDPEYLKLAQDSLLQLEQLSDSQYKQKIMKITHVTSQVVAGTLTNLHFQVAYTNCLRSNHQINIESECELLKDKPIRNCHSSIWNRPWLKDGKQITVTCDDLIKRTKRDTCGLPGGVCSVDETDPEYLKLAQDSLLQLEQLSDSQYKQKIMKITHVTSQVVAGTLTNLHFQVAYTNCLRSNHQINIESECELLKDKPIRNCHSSIWNRPWLKDGKQITVTCDDLIKRTKRDTCGLPGGVCSVDETDPKYLKLAQDSLLQLEQLSDSQYKQKIIRITHVTSQVVAGTLTELDFEVAYTKCLRDDFRINIESKCDLLENQQIRKCHSKVWNRPWIKDGKKINVSCDDSSPKRRIKESLQSKPDKFFTEVTMNSVNNIFERKSRDLPIISSELYGLSDIQLAHAAVRVLNSRHSDGNLMKLLKVCSVKRELNNALLIIQFDVGYTTCIIREPENPDNCDILEGLPPQHCHAEVFKRRRSVNPVGYDISVYCNKDIPSFTSILRNRLWALDLNADLVENRKEAQLALEKLTDTVYKMKALKVLSVSVNENEETGKIIIFIAAYTNCTLQHPIALLSECKILKKKKIRLCQAEIWSRGYMESTIQCDNISRNKRTSLDNPVPVRDADERYKDIAKESVTLLDLSSNSGSLQKFVKVNKAELLPGQIKRVQFEVAYTKCSKFEKIEDIDACEPLIKSPHRKCTTLVWERNWLKNGYAIDVHCKENDDVDIEDYDTALQLAELSLKHVEAKYIHPSKQNIVRIVSMDKQIVSGMHYRIKFEVGFTDCLVFDDSPNCNFTDLYGANKFCKANIWLRPWLDEPPSVRVKCKLNNNNTLIPDEIVLHLQAEKLFHQFLKQNPRAYINDNVELSKRLNIFKNNIRQIHEFNIRERGTAKYGVTQFADLTYEEFSKKHTGLRPDLKNANDVPMPKAVIPEGMLPESFDWRQKGAVTEVKNQGSCGSCWAFSVTGNIEGQYQIATGELLSLSEQELVDCDKLDEGCNGGLPDNAYRAIEQLGGLEEESVYPYDGDDEKCRFEAGRAAVTISGAVNVSSNETEMAHWLAANGPISIGINANAMQFYMGGVSHPWKVLCSPKNLDHGVLIVGYGVKNYPLFHKTLPYWIVKNSWGSGWGEQGYYRVFRGDGTCGLNLMASSAVVEPPKDVYK